MNLYQIQPGDEKERVFAAFTVADLKRLYNALAIDQATNEQPDQGYSGSIKPPRATYLFTITP
jgi:hypothetical protein